MDVTEIVSLPAAFGRQLARFERVSPFISSMVTVAAHGIALQRSMVTVISSKATGQQVESTGHGAVLDGGLA